MDFQYLELTLSKAEVEKERRKAREMRQSQWWKRKLAEGICYHCGQKFASELLTMDHLVPVSRGGKSTKGNVVVSCKDCNNAKKWKTPAEIILDSLKNS